MAEKLHSNPPEIIIWPATAPAHYRAAGQLFREYVRAIGIDLSFQQFEAEMEKLPEMYGPPRGALLLAAAGEEYAGCVAVRPLDDDVCEMKRMFVRPSYRRRRLGHRLTAEIMRAAVTLGYERMRLDTLQRMTAARRLYHAFGFYEIDAYYHNPLPAVVYMEARLRE